MNDYSRMTKADLIARLKKLESKAGHRAQRPRSKPNTERQPAGAALRDSEQRLRAILETAVEGIITIDERGTIESVNPAAEKLFGYRASEALGQNISLLMPSPYREQHDRYLSHYRDTGERKIIGIGREVSGQRKDGSVFPLELAVSEVRLAGRRIFTGFVRDISRRKQAEQELLEVNEDLTRFNRAAVDRELRMIELKREVNQLCTQVGLPPRYSLEFDKEKA